MLRRELRYKEITIVDILGTVTAALIGVVMAVMWRNEWALVGMELSRRIVRLVGFLFFARWVPKVQSSWLDFKELINFNLVNGTGNILQTFDQMLPKTLIGMTLGSHAVGRVQSARASVPAGQPGPDRAVCSRGNAGRVGHAGQPRDAASGHG
jgi:O-antigen/teichoic acid export membrane protein